MFFFNTSVKLLQANCRKTTAYFGLVNFEKTTTEFIQRWRSKWTKNRTDESCPDGTFTADEMELTILPVEKLKKKPDESSLKFGKGFTDYMFSVRWESKNGWGIPKIEPINQFRIHPASKCLQYGVEVFEGMQAYRGYDGNIRLFRPDLNMKRLLKGAKRMCLPLFDPNEFTECIKRLVKLEQEWIPGTEGSSLYIRPVYIGTDPSLRITAANSALLYVILCPVQGESRKPISLYADPKYAKSWPGGCGDIKAAGNYGSQIYLQRIAEQHDCEQIMWMQGKEHNIIDIGNMNIFFVVKNDAGEKELVTPPTNGLLLNGVIRESIKDLCNEWNEFGLNERDMTISEFKTLINEKKLKEIFGSGSTRLIAPVISIIYDGSKYDIPTVKQDRPIYKKIKKAISSIQYGKIDHDWGIRIDN